MAGKDAIAETRSESLDLRFNLIRHIRGAVERNRAVRPERVLTTRGARFIEQALLRDQHERALGNFSAHNLAFRRRNFVNAATEMNCPCVAASFGFPWDRLTQRVIDLQNTTPVPTHFHLTAIPRWKLFTSISHT